MTGGAVRAAGPVLALAAAHAAPSLTAVAPLRLACFPALSGRGEPGRVALTFDDGPDPKSTPAFLDLLADRGVSATFFLLGVMVERSPDLARRIVEAGHEIGVHGYHHRCLLWRGPRSTMDDIARATEVIADRTGTRPRWFRPPYGVLTSPAMVAAHRLGLRTVLWTAWGQDWTRTATPESIIRTVRRGLGPGGTILLHDSDCTSTAGSWRRTLAAVGPLLDYCARQGWRVGPLHAHGLPGAVHSGATPGRPRQLAGPREPRP